MTNALERGTWARLKEDTPFNEIFANNLVPIVSPIPIIPREAGNPPCYLVKGSALTDEQVAALAQLLSQYDPNTAGYGLDELQQYIRENLPLKTEWFCGVTSTDPAIMFSMMELGKALEDEEEDWEAEEDELPFPVFPSDEEWS